MRLELEMYAMVRAARPDLSHDQARAMAESCARGHRSTPAALPEPTTSMAPPPLTPPPPPQPPMPPSGPVDFPPAAPLGPPGHFRMEPDHHGFTQDNHNAYRGRDQYKKCEDVVPSSSDMPEVIVAPSIVPPHAGTQSRITSHSVAPVEPVSASSQPPFVARPEAGSAPPAP